MMEKEERKNFVNRLLEEGAPNPPSYSQYQKRFQFRNLQSSAKGGSNLLVISFLTGSILCNSFLVLAAQKYDYTTVFYGLNSIMSAIGLIGIVESYKPIFLVYAIYYGLSFLFEAMIYAAAIFVLYQDEAVELIQELGMSELVKYYDLANDGNRIKLLLETSLCSIGLLLVEVIVFDQLLKVAKNKFK